MIAVTTMHPKTMRDTVDLRHLRQIICGLDEGVILIDPDQSLLWANDAALEMHGVAELAEAAVAAGQVAAQRHQAVHAHGLQ